MRGALSKLIKLLLQIGGIITTLVVIAFVRVLLQRGYRLEVYSVTAIVIILVVLSWILRAWWSRRKEVKSNQKKLFDTEPELALSSNILRIVGWITGLLLILGIIGGLFYWFEIRPTKIRQECSWVKKHTDAQPVIPPMSDNEIRAAGCTNRGYGIYTDLVDKYCEEKKIGKPAEDAKNWIEPASKDIYDFCVRSKGLFR